MILALGLVAQAQARICTAVASGNWSTASTWSCGTVPTAGDTLIIPASRQVTINANITYSGSHMAVIVYGTWRFDGGGAKITMPCGSAVIIYPGGQVVPNASGSSQTIRICSTTYWQATDGTVSGPMGWPVNVLPVELIEYTAEVADLDVRLHWATATESGASHYRLERSANGIEWDHLTTIAAAGESLHRVDYVHVDHDVPPGTWFYRLTQIDLDGTVNDLGVVTATVKPDRGALRCTADADGRLRVFTEEPVEQGTVQVIELATGRQVHTGDISTDALSFTVQMSTSLRGGYTVRLLDRSCRFVLVQ